MLLLEPEDVRIVRRSGGEQQLRGAVRVAHGVPLAVGGSRRHHFSRDSGAARLRIPHGRRAFGAESLAQSRILPLSALSRSRLRQVRRGGQVLQERLSHHQRRQSRSSLSGHHQPFFFSFFFFIYYITLFFNAFFDI